MTHVLAGRGTRRELDAGPFQPLIDSFALHLRAQRKSPITVRTYTEAVRWFAGAHLIPAGLAGWDDVTGRDIQRWMVALLDTGRTGTYANNQYRAIQQFFKWLTTEDPDEPRANPMTGLRPPKADEKLVPVFTPAELAALLAACKGKGYQARRDTAILSLFHDTGIRLAELAGLNVDDVDLSKREAFVTGKGGKQRVVRFGHDAALAIDRYKRERARHRRASSAKLWLAAKGGPMTANGIYQMVARRGEETGVKVHPHKFRHHFSHTWLDNGGAEGDLMELNGWNSAAMLRKYGRSAANARARRSYDQIMKTM